MACPSVAERLPRGNLPRPGQRHAAAGLRGLVDRP